MLKKIIIGLLAIVVALLLIGFALPGNYEITKEATIDAPPDYVYEEVNNLEHWAKWSYWNTLDPDMKVTFGEVKSGVGASYSWIGNSSVGEGSLQITESLPNQSVSTDLFFMQSEDASKAWYKFEPAENGTKLTMGFSTDFGYNPLYRWMGVLMFPAEMEKAFDYNINHLKEIAEAKPKFTVKISEESVEPISYIGISSTMSTDDMNAVSAQMAKSFGELMAALTKAKVQLAGYPFCLYPMWDEEKKEMEMICALPVPTGANVPAKYPVKQTNGGTALKAIHMGDYNTLGETHNQINQYIAFKNLEINGAPWEVFVTDPETEPDTLKWITEVYYPINK